MFYYWHNKEGSVPMERENINLGNQIVLSGFNELDGGSMVILRKMIGNEVRKLSDRCEQFQELKLVMKKVHETKASQSYEVRGNIIDNGRTFHSEFTDRNVFMTVSKVLEKLEHELEHKN
jgi:ribosome-associated translation inhibitor RaiA